MILTQTIWSRAEENLVSSIINFLDIIKKGLAYQYLPDSIHIYQDYDKVLGKYAENSSKRS